MKTIMIILIQEQEKGLVFQILLMNIQNLSLLNINLQIRELEMLPYWLLTQIKQKKNQDGYQREDWQKCVKIHTIL